MNIVALTKKNCPKLYAMARRIAEVGDWGDGAIFDKIIALIEKLLPMFLDCFPMAARRRFVKSCKRPSKFQRERVLDLCCEASDIPLGETTADAIVTTLRGASRKELRAMFDEWHELQSA